MATRSSEENMHCAIKHVGIVDTSESIGQGTVCVFDDDTKLVTSATAATAGTHIAWRSETGKWPVTEGQKVTMVKIGCPVIIPVKVLTATGSATVGSLAVATTGGATTNLGAETGLIRPACEYREDGAAGDLVRGFLGVSPFSVA
jgi:hypothetical protein